MFPPALPYPSSIFATYSGQGIEGHSKIRDGRGKSKLFISTQSCLGFLCVISLLCVWTRAGCVSPGQWDSSFSCKINSHWVPKQYVCSKIFLLCHCWHLFLGCCQHFFIICLNLSLICLKTNFMVAYCQVFVGFSCLYCVIHKEL